jgi:Ni/Co efflux regulator RcnB
MHSRTLACLLITLSLLPGSFALAQDHGRQNDRGRDAQGWRDGPQNAHDNNGRNGDQGRSQGRGWDRRDERGAGPNHAFYRGQRLPTQYRSRQYVVNDWRSHQLHAPPRGYHWVQTGGDYVLAAIATGVILELLLNQ